MEDKVKLKLIELYRKKRLAEEELIDSENLTKLQEVMLKQEILNIKYAILTLNNL